VRTLHTLYGLTGVQPRRRSPRAHDHIAPLFLRNQVFGLIDAAYTELAVARTTLCGGVQV
jgi:hypothetical protein